jgi:hypothetical protein
MKKLIVIAALLVSTQAGAAIGFQTGNALMENLRAGDKIESGGGGQFDLANAMEGQGYILGVHDSLSGSYICTPRGVNIGQLVAIVKKYLLAHPEKLHDSAAFLVSVALSEAFPCK